jgi:hypothetical protein
MNFGQALAQLKAGGRVRRAGWNGKGMWLCLMAAVTIPEGIVNGRTKAFVRTGDLHVGAYIVMWTADGTWQPGWLASQADMLSEDWEVLSEGEA